MKDLILGFLLGGIVGLWFGVNLGKDQPLLTNPFVKTSDIQEMSEKFDEIQKDVSKRSKILYQDVKNAVESADTAQPENSSLNEAVQEESPK